MLKLAQEIHTEDSDNIVVVLDIHLFVFLKICIIYYKFKNPEG